jgi:DNA-binding transcriptional ArsR family regulator
MKSKPRWNNMSRDEASRYYTLLRDPARRKIIEILGEQGKSGFKELRSSLGLGVGTVYYHLDMLSEFVVQDKSRKYMLNDRGQLLYRSLKEGNVPTALDAGEAMSHRLGRWLFLSPVFFRMTRWEVFLPVSIAMLFLGAVGSALAKIEPIFFFYFPSYRSFENNAVMFFFSWIGLFLLAEILCYLLFRRTGGDLQLFAGMSFSSLPLAVFPYIHMVIPPFASRYVLLVFQVWTLLLFASALSFGKGLRLDHSILVSLIILYFNIVLLIALGLLT